MSFHSLVEEKKKEEGKWDERFPTQTQKLQSSQI